MALCEVWVYGSKYVANGGRDDNPQIYLICYYNIMTYTPRKYEGNAILP